MTKIIIDCDPGIDDALAIFFALGANALNVLAVTTVSGNRPVDQTFENARRLCAFAGRADIPVFRGALSPLEQSAPRSNLVHGADGLGGIVLPESAAQIEDRPAAVAILDILKREPKGTVTLVAIGPLTNLALAFALDPTTFARAGHLAIMGGAVLVPGNVTPVAEFNFWADPLAADRVLQSGVPIDLFSLDVTTQAVCTPQWLDTISQLPGRVSKPLAQMVSAYFSEDPLLHDPCPIAWLIAPEIFTAQPMHVRVETGLGHCCGKSIGWAANHRSCPGAANVHVHVGVDCPSLLNLMLPPLRNLESNGT